MSRIVTVTDIRRAGYCAPKIRTWFELHDLDFRAFLKDGIDIERLREIGDGHAMRVIATVEKDDDRG
jgi:hypothetical protein